MRHGITACILSLLLLCCAARSAEFFYMDHDPLSNEYTGPVGPLVLSGDIESGDYVRLLSKIAEDEDRFLASHRIIVAMNDGDVTEAIKIANLVRATFTEVIVGPLTGSCVGACFLVYAAAGERGTDRAHLLGLHRPGSDAAQDAAGLVRAYLEENAVPHYLIEELFRHGAGAVYWLSQHDEETLGAKSPSFAQLFAAKCGWSDAFEHAVYKGEKPMEDLKAMWACRDRLTHPAARNVLDTALKDRHPAQGTGHER